MISFWRQWVGLAAVLPIGALSLWAGGSGLNVVVVVNQQSTNSVQLGTYYCERRHVPPQNVLRINWTGGNVAWTLAQCQSTLVTPLANLLAAPGLANQIEVVALSMDIPYRVTSGTEANSTTAVLFYGFKHDDPGATGPCRLPGTSANPYAASERAFRSGLPGSTPGTFLATMLTGNTLDDAKRAVDQGVASDGSFPTQPVVLAKTTDTARNVRYSAFDNAIFEALVNGGLTIYRTNSNQTSGLSGLLGLQTGLATLQVSPGTFVAGALADSLTSYAGRLFETTGQTTLLAFLQAGAAGSYGTVVEPCNYPQKFPDPMDYFYQARGFALAECYYQSLANPYQGLIVGDPLAAPFAGPGQVAWIGLAPNATLAGTVNLNSVADAHDATRPLAQVDLFVDGTLASTVTAVPPTPGNALDLTLNGQPITYVVPPGATLADVADGLAGEINASTPLSQVQASVRGDRIQLKAIDLLQPGSSVTTTASQTIGSGTALTTFVRSSRADFLDSTARGWREFRVTGTSVTGDYLRLTVTKTNGTSTTVSVVNGTPADTTVQLTQRLRTLINATPALQGADGVSAEDTYPVGTTDIYFQLYARTPGRDAAQIQVLLESSANLTLNPPASSRLDENLGDLQPRNHLYLTAGTTHLPLTFPLDTTLLSDGYHALTLVAYEGSHTRVQAQTSQTVRVQNTSLAATFQSPSAGKSVAMAATLQFTVAANTPDIQQISLFSTGGLLASVANQSSTTFAIPGATLDLGLHPFYAIVAANNGTTYRTETLAVRIVASAPPTAARIESFAARWTRAGWVALTWRSGVEFDVLGYYVERQQNGGVWVRVAPEIVPAANDTRPTAYRLDDANATPSEPLRYRLVSIDLAGRADVLAETQARLELRTNLDLNDAEVRISVEGAPAGRLVVETTTDLEHGPWTPLGDVPTGDFATDPPRFVIRRDADRRFYRVRQE